MLIKFPKIFLANLLKEEYENVLVLKASKVCRNKQQKRNVCNYMQSKTTARNNLLNYKIAYIFNLSSLFQTSMTYAERCFVMVAETENFLGLDFSLVKKIFQSSKLHITSELEVFHAANDWISYKPEERFNLAKDLLLTVRLPLLSDQVLKCLISGSSSICKDIQCKILLENILQKNTNLLSQLPKNMFEIRYCNHELFNILTLKKYGNLIQLSGKDFKRNRPAIKNIKLSKFKSIVKGFCIKGDIYVIMKRNIKLMIIKKYSQISNTWKAVGDLKRRQDFCASALIDKINIFGGMNSSFDVCSSCVQYDTNTKKRKEIAQMNRKRWLAASTTYEGKIVVSGGMSDDQEADITNTVEIYDHIANKWKYMPNMLEERFYHSLVSIKSKLFVIGTFHTGEVYDKVTNRFTFIKPSTITVFDKAVQTTSIGNKIIVFTGNESTVMIYDTDKNKWYKKTYNCLKFRGCTAIIKIPKF